jgi:hypothetical protein
VIDLPLRSPTSTLKRTVSIFFGAVPRIPNVAYSPFGTFPPDQVIAWPVRDCVQPGFASASSSLKSVGIPSVTWSMPSRSSSFGTENVRSTSSPFRTAVGLSERCAKAGDANARNAIPLQTQMAGDDHALYLIRALSDLEDLLVAVEAGDRVLVHEAVAAVDLQRPVRRAM